MLLTACNCKLRLKGLSWSLVRWRLAVRQHTTLQNIRQWSALVQRELHHCRYRSVDVYRMLTVSLLSSSPKWRTLAFFCSKPALSLSLSKSIEWSRHIHVLPSHARAHPNARRIVAIFINFYLALLLCCLLFCFLIFVYYFECFFFHFYFRFMHCSDCIRLVSDAICICSHFLFLFLLLFLFLFLFYSVRLIERIERR